MATVPPQFPEPQPGLAAYPVVQRSAADRVRDAWHSRTESDYRFDFATALGWTILTCGIYGIYIVYQLVRRSRDHNSRRIELLDAAATFGWERAQAQGIADELRPAFERIGAPMATLRHLASEFRDPAIWAIIAVVARGIAEIVAFILLDGDLFTHDRAEGAIEYELSDIYTRLGAPIAPPDPARLKGRHNYGGRVAASLLTLGFYSFWWEYDVMTEGNRHFAENWVWEDQLAASVQHLQSVA